MKISELLVLAQEAVDEAKISDDLRQVAFQQSVQLLAQEAGLATIPPAGSGPARSRSAPDDRAEGAVQKIGRKLGLPLTVVGEVYADDGKGGVDVVVGVGKLDDSTAATTKQLALMVCGARQLAEIEQWTGAKEIRKWCVHYGRFDTANFAKTLKTMQESLTFKGKGPQLEVRCHHRDKE